MATCRKEANDGSGYRKTRYGELEKEAPPGFEPGMADLQSAALPLGEGANDARNVATTCTGVNVTLGRPGVLCILAIFTWQ